jgi:H+/Cl- antiporter ClcA/predicted transcriptional regulator
MARFGSSAIRGHGIPEAIERVLFHECRVPLRRPFLKTLSAAVAIGTGGPFGAEGPIIATGGALGSALGQFVPVTSAERRTLLAAGAAAGMAATFGTPVSAVLLAVELLLFEYRARSIIPVALAASAATAVRIAHEGGAPVFPMVALAQPGGAAIAAYIALGAAAGVASVGLTRLVYAMEDAFERLPVHWMWWPAIGGLGVGIAGLIEPRTLGVGYDNIENTLNGAIAGKALLALAFVKLVSWVVALGSGTSGGTLAPMLTIGGAMGALATVGLGHVLPGAGLDPRLGALVGMAAVFAGASRAMLASAVFAFEATRQPVGLLPLLGGCAAACLVSAAIMPTTIMTERIVRRGRRVPMGYTSDALEEILVGDVATSPVVTIAAGWTAAEAVAHVKDARHQGYPIVGPDGEVLGVVTRRELAAAPPDEEVTRIARRPPIVVSSDATLRDALGRMASTEVGRLPVVDPSTSRLVGILSRADVVRAHRRRLTSEHALQTPIPFGHRLRTRG